MFFFGVGFFCRFGVGVVFVCSVLGPMRMSCFFLEV